MTSTTSTSEDLIQRLTAQLDYYFSPQNLKQDSFLISQLNANRGQVSVDVIANFNRIKSLTEDKSLVIAAMRQCKNLTVDEAGQMVRPTLKVERTTLILRDIDRNTPKSEIEAIFSSSQFKPTDIHPDIEDNWFVTFESEHACTETALWLLSQTFQGKPIRCRVKTELSARSLLSSVSVKPENSGASGSKVGQFNPYNYTNLQYWYGGNGAYPQNMYYNMYNQHHGKGRGPREHRERRDDEKSESSSEAHSDRKESRSERSKHRPNVAQPPSRDDFPALSPPNGLKVLDRKLVHDTIEKFKANPLPKPEFDPVDAPVLRDEPLTTTMLMDPFPVFYPASPSPELAARPHASIDIPDLSLGHSAAFSNALDASAFSFPPPAAALYEKKAQPKKNIPLASGSNKTSSGSSSSAAGRPNKPRSSSPSSKQSQSKTSQSKPKGSKKDGSEPKKSGWKKAEDHSSSSSSGFEENKLLALASQSPVPVPSPATNVPQPKLTNWSAKIGSLSPEEVQARAAAAAAKKAKEDASKKAPKEKEEKTKPQEEKEKEKEKEAPRDKSKNKDRKKQQRKHEKKETEINQAPAVTPAPIVSAEGSWAAKVKAAASLSASQNAAPSQSSQSVAPQSSPATQPAAPASQTAQ